jgi:hypothetical protein
LQHENKEVYEDKGGTTSGHCCRAVRNQHHFRVPVRIAHAGAHGAGRSGAVAVSQRAFAQSADFEESGVMTRSTVVEIGGICGVVLLAIVLYQYWKDRRVISQPCNIEASIDLVVAGNSQIVEGSPGLNIYLCRLEVQTPSAEDIKLTEGTGVMCSVSTKDVSTLMREMLKWSFEPGAGKPILVTQIPGDSLCINQSKAQATHVRVLASKHGEPCFAFGKEWHARKDGNCYTEDAPK